MRSTVSVMLFDTWWAQKTAHSPASLIKMTNMWPRLHRTFTSNRYNAPNWDTCMYYSRSVERVISRISVLSILLAFLSYWHDICACDNTVCKTWKHQCAFMRSSSCYTIHDGTASHAGMLLCDAIDPARSRNALSREKPKYRAIAQHSRPCIREYQHSTTKVGSEVANIEISSRARILFSWIGFQKSISDARLIQLPAAPTLATVLPAWPLTNMWVSTERATDTAR